MPQKSWAVGEEVLAADFNTYVQAQVVPQFTNAAQRDAQWAAPPAGSHCFLLDVRRLLEYQSVTTGWTTPWNLPWGVLGYVERITDAGPISSDTPISGLSVTVTLPANRRVEVTVGVRGFGAAALAIVTELKLMEGATQLQSGLVVCSSAYGAGTGSGITVSRVLTPTAAAHTYSVNVTPGGGGNITMQAAATYPAWLRVTDLGPNGLPA